MVDHVDGSESAFGKVEDPSGAGERPAVLALHLLRPPAEGPALERLGDFVEIRLAGKEHRHALREGEFIHGASLYAFFCRLGGRIRGSGARASPAGRTAPDLRR